MIKKTLIGFASFIVVTLLYNFYCDHFWGNYFEEHAIYDIVIKEKERNTFSFSPHADIPSDSMVTSDNFWKYIWSRQLVEPNHAQWINDVTISFDSDSTIFYRVTARYIDKNYWTYPIFKKFRCSENETYTHFLDFDKKSMSFVDHREDTVKIEIDNNSLVIDHVFL
ncbi:MAG: hypothetical protein WC964_04305 [Acholeplasmataceae bacterium]